MDRVGDRIGRLFEEIDAMPSGPAERALIDEAVTLADEQDLAELGYAARLRLLASAGRTGDTDAQLSAFAWCTGLNDADPVRFPARVGDLDLLWFHKHVIGTLLAGPLFSLDDVESAIEAMQEAYQKAGVGLSGVWQARFQTATQRGRLDVAGRMLGALRRTPRDAYSHCATCVRAEEAEFLYLSGHEAQGLALAEEIIDQGMTCGDEPENTIAQALLPMLRAGRPEEARQLHLRGYRIARAAPDNLRMIAQHLRFCAVTGNEARGLEILEEHLPRLPHDGLDARAHLDLLSAAWVLLTAAERAGAGGQVVRAASTPGLVRFLGEHEGPWTVRALIPPVHARAAELAAAFDLRNGTDFRTRLLAADGELLNTRYDVPLTTRPARSAARVLPENAGQLRDRAAELRQEAGRLAESDPARALAVAREGLRLALLLGERELATGIARVGAVAATTIGDAGAAVDLCRTAVREAAAGELPVELVARQELGAALVRAGEADEGTVELEEVIRRLRASGAPAAVLAEAHFLLGQALAADQDAQAAQAALADYRDAVALASRAGDPAATTRYALALGEKLVASGQPEGLNVLAAAVESARQVHGSPLVLVRALHQLGHALSEADEKATPGAGEAAEQVLIEALRLASAPAVTEDPRLAYEHADILGSLARTIGSHVEDRWDEAVRLARFSAEAFLAVSSPAEAGRALLLAARLLRDLGRSAEALPLLEQAGELTRDQPGLQLQCLTGLAEVYGRLGRAAEALAAGQRAEKLMRQWGHLPAC